MTHSENYFVVMPAAGLGQRFGGTVKKQYCDMEGQPMLCVTVQHFLADANLCRIVVCVSPEDLAGTRQILPDDGRIVVVCGGSSRAHSVRAGVYALGEISADAVILVHDAVRPYVNAAVIRRVLSAVRVGTAAVPGINVSDTIKKIGDNGLVIETPERLSLRAVQTPQGFRAGILHAVCAQAGEDLARFTDEAMLVESFGYSVVCVEGDRENMKITTILDMPQKSTSTLGKRSVPAFRLGIGYDVHRMVEGRRCRIGGVDFQHSRGPCGHSDADVLLHAVADALLGACALGDLGTHFPDSDPQWQGADSVLLLKHCLSLVRQKGYAVGNLDTVIICERPKIGPQRDEIRKVLAAALETDVEVISVKATTEEKMGFTGSEEGIAAWAHVLLIKIS